tara:strand:+ start:3396 stop:5036 length:1641 start_codon:yes stop_codon:yes gene_type:complete
MARFGSLDTQYFDASGDPLVSGKIYFYESGTTTAKTTYADINNTIPNTNPVLLDASGRQPNIFFEGVAKATLTNSGDTQIVSRDPVGQTATSFGDEWVSSKIYSANDVVVASDGLYYRSLAAGNQNNNPVTTSGFWSLLYSVEWNAGITYDTGATVVYLTIQYQSIQASNLNHQPDTSGAWWVPLEFVWSATTTYELNQNVVGTDGILYTSLQATNLNHIPASSPAYWVGTSAAAAASATAAAGSATAAAASAVDAQTAQTAAELAETNAETAETNSAASASAASTSAANSATSAVASAASAVASAASASASATSATAAETALDDFTDIYLGDFSSDPTTDNDGGPLAAGMLYYNTSTNIMRVYSGSAWQNVAATATSILLSQVSDVTATAAEVNVLSGTTVTTAEINYLDIAALGTNAASKAVTCDASGDSDFASGSISDEFGLLRTVPPVGTKTTSYTLAVGDVGQYVQVGTSGVIVIPDATFAEGDAISIFNNTAGDITITCSITTAYVAGTDADVASATLATRGVATILFISGTVCVITGNV